jgi:hypothetical protein
MSEFDWLDLEPSALFAHIFQTMQDLMNTTEEELPAGILGAVAFCVGIDFDAISSMTRLPDHAARSMV